MLHASRLAGIPGTGRLMRLIGQSLDRARSRWFEGGLSPVRREVETILRQREFDVAYFPYPYFIRPPAIAAPIVGTFHDFNYRHSDSLDAPMRFRLERQAPQWLRACKKIVVSTRFIQKELESFYPGFEEKTRLIRPAVPFPDRFPTPDELRAFSEKIRLQKDFLLTTGWVVPHKNQAVAFEALADLKDAGKDMALVCVGPNSLELLPEVNGRGPYAQKVFDLIAQRGLVAGVDYLALGYVSDFDLQCLYKLAKAVVIPALYEAGSFTGVEAMRAGCPVIFSHTAPNLEQAELVDGQAWLFDPRDADDLRRALQEIDEDPEGTLETCRRAAEKVASNLSWERTAAGYLEAFEEALARS